MAPGSCVHASSWTIDSSVDPENFHPDDLQQCVSPPHHSNHSFPVSSLGNSIPCWGPLSAQYLRDPASAGEVPRMDVASLTNLYHLLYSGLILQNFLPMQGGSSRHRVLEGEIFSPNFGAASSSQN